ncbi:DUF692 domain-containing protein [Chloracidobacterium validum]|uniref:DUF692 domain-containing protein n=1 Tax=Chloracidobacterium validum TaxID=2821543 RepID=A0ABX8B845_9BACT|nr:DUF692 domain-containing protein [Chloracidobacterium validum]QUW03116.1 DUF692 domain-containing protein [Chloracidobacterium validum]
MRPMAPVTDRVGLGWRALLAADILANLDRIDVVEVIADDYFDAPQRDRQALRLLGRQVPLVLHGVSLGLASTVPVDVVRLDHMARLIEDVEPWFWSEHLAFVRGGGVEIGHLAAPPRTAATIEGTARNLATTRTIVGSAPLVENVSTLFEPPGSTLDEATWLRGVLAATENDLLLDLHNLYTNGCNCDFDPYDVIANLPLERVGCIHIAGGKWVQATRFPGRRRLDDHRHATPPPVFDLLTEVARRARQPLVVILERDGDYPAFDELLAELDAARAALAHGRAAQLAKPDVVATI